MLVATKDPAAMSNEEKSIRTNLINARQLDFSIPLAPSICEFECCKKYAVGARCNNDEFSTYELVAAYIRKVKDKTVALLNYGEAEVSQTLMVLNDGMNDAAGFTQESHNCNNNSDWDSDSGNDGDNPMENGSLCDGSENNDDNPIAFSWDASETPECKASSSAYAEAAPLWKELMQELDEASPSTRNYGIGILKGSIIELKSRNAKRALSFCEGGVQGGIVSSKVKSKATKSKHRKQEYYPGRK
jgi:hypothetical protein